MNRDYRIIQIFGSFCAILGLILLGLTALIALVAAFSGGSDDPGAFIRGALAIALALIMSTTLMGCGIRLAEVRKRSLADRQSIRLSWTALVVVMAAAGLAGLGPTPILTLIAGIALLGLFAIRPAVRRILYSSN